MEKYRRISSDEDKHPHKVLSQEVPLNFVKGIICQGILTHSLSHTGAGRLAAEYQDSEPRADLN